MLVADEPVSALDVSIQAQMINLLMSLQERFRLTLLVIAHDLAVVRHVSDRIAVMYLGKLMEVSAGGRPLRESSPPVHDLAALRRADRRPRRRARAEEHPAGRGPAEPRQPTAGVPLPHALPLRPADALPGRGAATSRARSRPHGCLSLGRGHQVGQAEAQGGRARRARSRSPSPMPVSPREEVVPLRAEPREDAEQVTQVLRGSR